MGCPESKPVPQARPIQNEVPRSFDKEEDFYRLHPGLHNPSPEVPGSMVSTDVRDIEKAETKVIKVQNINVNIRQNTRAHHTDEFDITNIQLSPHQEECLVLRRGQPFEISLQLDRPYNKEQDDVRLVFRFGKRPLPSRGTHVEITPSANLVPKKWGAVIITQNENTLRLHLLTPPTCAIGRWELNIDVVKKEETRTLVYRYKHRGRIYVLFNPWCKDDNVYMSETKLLNEYVLNETGKIFSGTYKEKISKPWSFGQFTGVVLDCCMYILDASKLPDHARGNPVLIARKISAMVNSPDDNGVVVGKWSGSFADGIYPLDWTGSVNILQQYYRTRRPVKYGQCWVFSGVLTTVCRALGIPCRCVTNFNSAHDTNGSLTVDIHNDATGNPLHYMNTDSVWNYHVWNDVWMTRPDLPQGYGGWQAIDATPQQASEGVYCMGPTSLMAVKRGEIEYPYDGRFLFAEVNADKLYWTLGDDFALRLNRIDKHSVGQYICTKRVGNRLTWAEYTSGTTADNEDITGQYKYQEGSEEERVAVRNASSVLETSLTQPESVSEDVAFELSTNDGALVGDNIETVLKVKNMSNDKRTLNGRITVSTIHYTGVHNKYVGFLPVEDKVIEGGEADEIRMTVKPEGYFGLMSGQCFCRIACMIGVKETKQIYTDSDVMRLRKPDLTIQAPDNGTVGRTINVEVSFDNPLPFQLMNCELKVEGPGLQLPVTYKQRDVGGKETFKGNFSMTPAKTGEREIIVCFTSTQMSDIIESHTIKIH